MGWDPTTEGERQLPAQVPGLGRVPAGGDDGAGLPFDPEALGVPVEEAGGPVSGSSKMELLRFATAGSVDDGKSTLIGRLLFDSRGIYEDQLSAIERDSKKLNRDEIDLALVTDGLMAEREQAITIDVAYRSFSTPRRRFIIADVPGHEQYTRNMVTGAATASLAVILIDARQGVLPQSKRHGFIASLLGIPHLVVAINKMDLVGYSEEVFERIRTEYSDFAARLRVSDITYIPISALKGDNVVRPSRKMRWYRGVPLLLHLENVYIGGDTNLIDFRFPVQYVLRPNYDFRGYCGQIASGVVRPGDEVMVLPSGRMTRVKSIVSYDGNLSYAFAPQSVTVCLEDEIDVSRGDMLVHPKNVPHHDREIEAMLVWLDEKPLRLNSPYLIKHTTNWVRGSFNLLHYRVNPDTLRREEAADLRLNDIGRVALRLFRPILWDEYARNRQTGSFVVIDPMTHSTVGAGMIIERAEQKDGGQRDTTEVSPTPKLTREEGLVSREQRARLLGQKAVTVWLTGLSGSGKSTVAKLLEKRLIEEGHPCFVLDGDNVRHGLNSDLGFSRTDRKENIRRVAQVARLFNEAGFIVIAAFISPYRADRSEARAIIGEQQFIEVFVEASLAVCEKRDPKGLYRRARSGAVEEFTGVSAPYEVPENPDVHLNTEVNPAEEGAERLLGFLRERGILEA